MKEPENPIKVKIKGKLYPPPICFTAPRPFSLFCSEFTTVILKGEEPIYFKRKLNKPKYNSETKKLELELVSIKYRIGKKTASGKEEAVWVDSEGKIIKEK